MKQKKGIPTHLINISRLFTKIIRINNFNLKLEKGDLKVSPKPPQYRDGNIDKHFHFLCNYYIYLPPKSQLSLSSTVPESHINISNPIVSILTTILSSTMNKQIDINKANLRSTMPKCKTFFSSNLILIMNSYFMSKFDLGEN